MKGNSVNKGLLSRGDIVNLKWFEKVFLSGHSFKHKIIYHYPNCMEMRASHTSEGS